MFISNELKLVQNYGTSLLKESVISTLTNQQKKIFIIASIAIGFIAICFHFTKRWIKTHHNDNLTNLQQAVDKLEKGAAVDNLEAI